MNLKIDFDDLKFRAAAQRAARELKANVPELVREEVRLFIGEYRKRTPPFAAYGKNESAAADMKIGKGAIVRDLGKVAITLDSDPSKMAPRLRKLIEKGDDSGAQAYLNNVRAAGLRGRQLLKGSALKSAHLAARNRYGRVKQALRNATTAVEFHAYVEKLFKLLGHNKGSFNAASIATGEKRVPAYVRAAGSLGGYTEDGAGEQFAATLTGRSTVPGAQRAVREAIVIRAKKLTAEVERIARTFAKTGKIVSRRRSLNS